MLFVAYDCNAGRNNRHLHLLSNKSAPAAGTHKLTCFGTTTLNKDCHNLAVTDKVFACLDSLAVTCTPFNGECTERTD